MRRRSPTAEDALRATQSVRASRGYEQLPPGEREELERNLASLERILASEPATSARYGGPLTEPSSRLASDPFAAALDAPPSPLPPGLRGPLGGGPLGGGPLGGGPLGGGPPVPAAPTSAPASPPPAAPSSLDTLGGRARQALEAVDFPAFVAGLVQSTFQAIVDATAQQVREYARLVASISQSAEQFSRENVSANQARDLLVERHPQDLILRLPSTGQRGSPRVEPRHHGSPAWLERYGLGGESLSPEFVEGPLLEAARRSAGEERIQTLATMVLMGINRIVVDEGHIRAKLQFHARATDSVTAQAVFQTGGQQTGIAARDAGAQASAATMVSTVAVNAQQDAALKTDLMGEVHIKFRTQTFDLDRFADSPAIQLIQRHARWQAPAAAPATTPAPAPAAPTPRREGT